jgi:hypothetical protein
MAVMIGVLTCAAILIGIAVTILLAIAALVEVLPPLFAGGTEGDDRRAARAVRPSPEGKPAARSGVRFTRRSEADSDPNRDERRLGTTLVLRDAHVTRFDEEASRVGHRKLESDSRIP